ncbi:MAG: PKD domain-containing protein [Bacteroidetes bacterium]|nr:PKD domain-containing protein [Bacteroidota bacterium]
MGDGTDVYKSTPQQIGTENNWVSLSAAGENTVALKSNGTLWAWGNNESGQLGNGTNLNSNIPVQIGTETNWVSVSAGEQHAIALKSDGTLWAWGNNYYGQLGDGTNANQNTPIQIGIGSTWISIATGALHTVAIKSDGSLWAWGHNGEGLLGDIPNSNTNFPIQIGNENTWAKVETKYNHFVLLKSDGTMWAWGNNYEGQLGDGTNTNRNIPVQVGTSSNWVSMTTGWATTVAVKSDGSLWSWGLNGHGQLGDGTTTNRNTPTQICAASNCSLPTQPDSIITRSDYVIADSVAMFKVVPVAGASSYQWTLPAGWSFRFGQGTDSIVVNTTQNGGMLQVVAQNACGNSAAELLNVIPYAPVPKPVLSGGGSGVSSSSGGSATISINPVPNVVRYIWLIPPGFVLVSGGGETDTFAVVMPIGGGGTVTVTAQGAGGVSNTLTIPVTQSSRWDPSNPLSKGPIMEWASAQPPLISSFAGNPIVMLDNGDFYLAAGNRIIPTTQINFSSSIQSLDETIGGPMIAKFDSSGNLKNYLIIPSDANLSLKSIQKTSDNGLIAVFQSDRVGGVHNFDFGSGFYELNNDILPWASQFIVKYSSQLAIEWAKGFNSQTISGDQAISIDGQGDIYLAFSTPPSTMFLTNASGIEQSWGTSQSGILKLNSDGSFSDWINVNSSPAVIQSNSSNNELFVFGRSTNGNAFVISKLLADGSLVKEITLPGNYLAHKSAIEVKNNRVILGLTVLNNSEDLNYGTAQNPILVPFARNNQGLQIALLCYDNNLSPIWAKGLLRKDENAGMANMLDALTISSDSTIWITGFTYSGQSQAGVDFDPGPNSFYPTPLLPYGDNAYNYIALYNWNGELNSAFFTHNHSGGGQSSVLRSNSKGKVLSYSRGPNNFFTDAQSNRLPYDGFDPRNRDFRIPIFYPTPIGPNQSVGVPLALAMYKSGIQGGPQLVSQAMPQVCAGQSVSLAVSGNGPFTWFTQASGGQSIHTGASFTAANISRDTVFYVQDALYPATSRLAVSVKANPLPKLVVTTPALGAQATTGSATSDGNNGQLLCSGKVLFSAVDSNNVANRFVFNYGDGSALDTLSNGAFVKHEYPVNTNLNWFSPGYPNSRYNVEVTAISDKGCSTLTSITRDVKNAPKAVITLASASTQTLAGNSFSLGSASVNNHPSYIQSHYWDFGDGNTSSQSYLAPKSYQHTGTYNVKLIVQSNTGCTDTATQVLTVIADTAANPGNACGLVTGFTVVNNDSVQEFFSNSFSFFNTTTHTGFGWANAFSWDFGDGTSSSNTFVYNKTYGAPGVYTVTLTATSSRGCVASYSRAIRVIASLSSAFTYNVSECGSKQVQFNNTANNQAQSYYWDFGDGMSSTEANPVHTYSNPGAYRVQLTLNGNNVSPVQTLVISTELPQASISVKRLACNNAYLFMADAQGVGLTFDWAFSLASGSGHTVGQAVNRSYSQAGFESVALTVSSGACSTVVNLNQYPVEAATSVANLEFQSQMLENGSCQTGVQFTAPIQENALYMWDFGDGNKVETSSNQMFHAYQSTGVYYPTLTLKTGDCSLMSTQPVTVTAVGAGVPEAAFKLIYRPNTQCIIGNRYDFFNTTQLNGWGWVPYYYWDFGDGASSTQTFIYGKSYTRAGTYTVTLRAVSNLGCTTTVSTQVTVLDNPCEGITWGNKTSKGAAGDDFTGESGFSTGQAKLGKSSIATGIYPNPSSGKATLDMREWPETKVEIKVYDALGRLWQLENPIRKTGQETELDLSGLPNGQYHVHLESGIHQSQVLPLVIVR